MTGTLVGVDGRPLDLYGRPLSPQYGQYGNVWDASQFVTPGYGAFAIPDPNPYPYPAQAPLVNGTLITLDRWAKQPTLLLKVIEDLSSQQFLTDSIFRPTTANGGAIIYDVAASQDLYIDPDVNRQPQSIAPGAAWPEVGFRALTSLVQQVTKFGGLFHLSYEQVRRDARDIMAREVRRLSNTLIKMSDDRVVALLTAGVTATTIPSMNVPVGGNWFGTTPTFINDMTAAMSVISANELNYVPDTAWGHPLDLNMIPAIKDMYLHLPRENLTKNSIYNPTLQGLLSMDWVSSRRWPRGMIGVGMKQQLGALASEIAPYTRTTDDPLRERWSIQSGRVEAGVITDPQSFIMIKGLTN